MNAFNIWNNFNNQLFGLICTRVKHADHCHDIMQNVYLKVSQNIDKISNADNVKSYLIKIADNAINDHYRKKENLEKVEIFGDEILIDEAPFPEKSLQLADCCLRPMIDSLPEIYRDALIKTELEGMKHKDYALHAGISLSNAKVRVQRAKEQLKQLILQCCNYQFDRYGNIVDCAVESKSTCCNGQN